MSIDIYVLGPRTTTIDVGDTSHRIGVLERAGQSGLPGTLAAIAKHAERWKGKTGPRAVLIRGETGDRETGGRVISWEPGMTEANDFNWADMPDLGMAVANNDGKLELHRDGKRLTEELAHTIGVLANDGGLRVVRRPRIVKGAVVDVEQSYLDTSSLGSRPRYSSSLVMELDNGSSRTLHLAVECHWPDASISLVGMTESEAWRIAQQHRIDAPARQQGFVEPCKFGALFVEYGAGKTARVVTSSDGLVTLSIFDNEALTRQTTVHPVDALVEIANVAAADSGATAIGVETLIAWQIGENIGILVVAGANGALGFMSGPRLPEAMLSVGRQDKIGQVDQFRASTSLAGWRPEILTVPPRSIAVFLGDLSIWIEDIHARTMDGQKPLSFGEWQRSHGIDYDSETPVPH